MQVEGIHTEAYENFSIDTAPFRKNPIKIKMSYYQPLLPGENYTEIKA